MTAPVSFCLLVAAAPGSWHSRAALDTAQAIITAQLSLAGLFFYDRGVLNGDIQSPLSSDWSTFLQKHRIEGSICSGSAEKQHLDTSRLASGFAIAGLGTLAESKTRAHRVLTFSGPVEASMAK